MSLSSAVARALSLALGLLALLIAVNLPSLVNGLALADHWYESPGAFPLVAACLMLVGAAIHLLRLWRRGDAALGAEEVEAGDGRLRVALVGLSLFVLLIPIVLVLGFAPAVGLFLLAATRCSGLPWERSTVFAVTTAVVLQLVFVEVFKVWFPQPWLSGWAS